MTSLTKQQDRKDKIARIAARLFARHGYQGTSMQEIARLAGVAENTLFRNFETKENLFWASLRVSLAGWGLHPNLLEALDSKADPQVVLPRFVAQVVDATFLSPELLRLIIIAFIERRSKTMELCRESLAPLLCALQQYLAAHIDQSRLKDLDPALFAEAIITMASMHPVFMEFTDSPRMPFSNQREMIRALSKFWIEVLGPPKVVAHS